MTLVVVFLIAFVGMFWHHKHIEPRLTFLKRTWWSFVAGVYFAVMVGACFAAGYLVVGGFGLLVANLFGLVR